MSEAKKESETVTLSVESPDMLRDRNKRFEVEFPRILSEESYQLIRWNLEFRRKCMNQGFDNLLELLEQHWKVFKEAASKEKPDADPPPT